MDTIELAKKLIRCPSVTPEDAGALDAIIDVLKPMGFRCWKIRFEGEDSVPVDNLYARLGRAGPNFCFAGHTDVVPPGDVAGWKFDPFGAVSSDGRLYGRGAEDMKGAIAAFIAAVWGFIAVHGREFGGSISLLITGDEEGDAINGTRKVLKFIEEKGEKLDACLVGEPTNPEKLGEMVKIGRRGSLSCDLTIRGTQGHIAYPHLADNPVTRLVDILYDLKHYALDQGTEYFQPSNLEVISIDVGNPASNVIPASAAARFNIRFNTEHTRRTLTQWIGTICEKHAPERHHLVARCSAMPFITKPGELSGLVTRAIKDVLGVTPELGTSGGTSDARFIKDYCPVVEFGTTGKTAHKVNECVRIEDLYNLSDIYKRILDYQFYTVEF